VQNLAKPDEELQEFGSLYKQVHFSAAATLYVRNVSYYFAKYDEM